MRKFLSNGWMDGTCCTTNPQQIEVVEFQAYPALSRGSIRRDGVLRQVPWMGRD